MENKIAMRFSAVCLVVIGLSCALPLGAGASQARTQALLAVSYASDADLARAVADGRADVVRLLPRLHVAEVRPHVDGFAVAAREVNGIRYVQRVVMRRITSLQVCERKPAARRPES